MIKFLRGIVNLNRCSKVECCRNILTSDSNNHLRLTVHASDMDALGSPDRIATTGADIFAAAGWLRRWRCGIAVVIASAGNRDTIELIPCDKNVWKFIFKHKVQQFIRWRCQRPAVFLVVGYIQSMSFCNLFETLVVVGIASAGVLDAVELAIVMAHLMEQISTETTFPP